MKHLSFAIFAVAALAFFSCKEKEDPVEPAGPEVVVTLNEHEVSLNKGQTAQLTCTAEGLAPGAQVFWRSQNSRIITVKDGVITPVSGGTTRSSPAGTSTGIPARCPWWSPWRRWP